MNPLTIDALLQETGWAFMLPRNRWITSRGRLVTRRVIRVSDGSLPPSDLMNLLELAGFTVYYCETNPQTLFVRCA
jgi:hypothetical protein